MTPGDPSGVRPPACYPASVLQVVVSPSGADRVAAAGAFLRAFPPATEVLVVGASREAVDDFIRVAVRGEPEAGRADESEKARSAADAGASFGLHRFSLTQLAARVAAGELATRRLAPGSGLAALDSRRVAGLGPAGADLAELLVEFETQLTAAAATDRATLLDTAARAVREGAAGTLPLVLLDVPIHSRGQRALVGALLAMAPRALVTIPTGDDRTREAIAVLGDGRESEAPQAQGKTAPSG